MLVKLELSFKNAQIQCLHHTLEHLAEKDKE